MSRTSVLVQGGRRTIPTKDHPADDDEAAVATAPRGVVPNVALAPTTLELTEDVCATLVGVAFICTAQYHTIVPFSETLLYEHESSGPTPLHEEVDTTVPFDWKVPDESRALSRSSRSAFPLWVAVLARRVLSPSVFTPIDKDDDMVPDLVHCGSNCGSAGWSLFGAGTMPPNMSLLATFFFPGPPRTACHARERMPMG
eukprot:CAMPEP_0117547596 /NCGR_PEP_ID=MMETSP0784-20121206/47206_1 /TAXON_ID=39447 /ORGANISM="" /LENGTH=198 /DNA_ID=CAMNT_0005344507 /DNA_START=357 /DNA_END=951 /DNA_ORIENTATION=-